MNYLLELNDIVKSFPGVLALNHMRFNLLAGEAHAICGENGAGKSTLMKIISGVHQPDHGEIRIGGQPWRLATPLDALKAGVAVIYQETSQFEEMTVLENLFLCHEPKKRFGFLPVLDYEQMRRKVKQTFAELQADIDPDARIKELGMAQKQMVEIAKALTYHSRILILDEPTASLTKREVDALFAIVGRLKAQGVGIVYISHRLDEIFRLCDRVTVMRDGEYVSTQNVAQTDEQELIRGMVGRAVHCYAPVKGVESSELFFEVERLSLPGYVRKISFSAHKHEIIGFAGLAGSGRTEMAEAICALRPKSEGTLYVQGKQLSIHDYREAMKQGIVYVSEDRGKYGLITAMSIAENISLPQLEHLSRAGLIDREKEAALAARFIEKIGIRTPDEHFLVANLSGGNQQKVALAKALALSPKVLILDEPTRGVDVGAKAEIHRMIGELAHEEMTIMVISSELPELLCLCDRIYVMKEGELAACFKREEATQERILELALVQH